MDILTERYGDIMTNRYVCDVLREMRKSIKVMRIDMLPGLIEEVQIMANRMEAKLADYANIGYDLERATDFRNELKRLRKKAEEITNQLDEEE
jgi:hypothetical protein